VRLPPRGNSLPRPPPLRMPRRRRRYPRAPFRVAQNAELAPAAGQLGAARTEREASPKRLLAFFAAPHALPFRLPPGDFLAFDPSPSLPTHAVGSVARPAPPSSAHLGLRGQSSVAFSLSQYRTASDLRPPAVHSLSPAAGAHRPFGRRLTGAVHHDTTTYGRGGRDDMRQCMVVVVVVVVGDM
jgi:hypothetical protein